MLFFRYGRVWHQSGRKWHNRLWYKRLNRSVSLPRERSRR